ncbi:MAG: hypothetical protein EOO03_04335 [Chitinophagaceae bacterium]|nr:MAG: hypothetical protein EOO03_04335 [Chitinophagaceae bacterium]
MKTSTSQTGELWQTTHQWLGLSGHAVSKKYCREEIGTHPDYPALTSLTDFLDAGGLEYNAVQADATYIHEFNYPLLAHIKQHGHEWLHMFTAPAEWDNQKDITSHWSGVCIYPEKSSRWSGKENDVYLLNDQKRKGQLFIAGGLVVTLYALAVVNNPTFIFAAIGLLSIVGLITSILLAGEELGVQNSFVKQVCGAVNNGGCAKVLKSPYAAGFAGVTASDLAIIYFATQLIAVFCSALYPAIFNAILLLSLAGILAAGWSIYAQAVLVKQWCALCLGIVAVLVLQSLIALFVVYNAGFHTLFSIDALLPYAGIALVIALAQLPIKNLLKTNFINGQKLAELKKWKMDAGLFVSQWQNEQTVDTTIWENDLLIGNPNAPIKITVACNPYCGPCAKAHEQLDAMLAKHKNKFCVQVRFLSNASNGKDPRTIAVKAILQHAYEICDNKKLAQMLSDWFEHMNYEQWIVKWEVKSHYDVQARLQDHQTWVDENNIAFTPTFFVNGSKLPGRYGLDEIETLLPQLANIFAEQQPVE